MPDWLAVRSMADGGQHQYTRSAWSNPNLPSNYTDWGAFIEEVARQFVHRYGIEEVSTWMFEVWNEPDSYPGFFNGTFEDYFHLYDVTARALKEVDARLRVGGPAANCCSCMSSHSRSHHGRA